MHAAVREGEMTKRVYTYGFSQNGMASAYVGRCFAEAVTGSWIGGGGLFGLGHGPVPPHKEGTCVDADAASGCRVDETQADKCCKYWPAYPCHTDTAATTVQADRLSGSSVTLTKGVMLPNALTSCVRSGRY